jgi:hypothetical protein
MLNSKLLIFFSCIIIKREQFLKMSELLKISTSELSKMVFKMTKEERFSKLKQFYLKTIPESKEFYQKFSKKSNSNESKKENEFEENESLKDIFELIQEDEEEVVDLIESNNMTDDFSNSASTSTPSKKDYDKYDKLFDDLFKD